MIEPLVPLSHLQLEGLGTAEELARRFADVCLINDLGRVCVDRPTAAAAIGEHAAREARTRDRQRQRRERLAAQPDPVHERLAARATIDPSGDPLADLMHGDPDTALARSASALDEMLTNAGNPIYHPHQRSDP